MSKASKIMAERLAEQSQGEAGVEFRDHEVIGDEERGMTGVKVKNLLSGEETHIEAPGMFVAIGHTPNTKFSQRAARGGSEGVHRA